MLEDIRRGLDNPVVFAVVLIMVLWPLALIMQWMFTAAHWSGPAQALGG